MSEPLVKYWVGKPHIFTTPSPGNERAYVSFYKAANVEAQLAAVIKERDESQAKLMIACEALDQSDAQLAAVTQERDTLEGKLIRLQEFVNKSAYGRDLAEAQTTIDSMKGHAEAYASIFFQTPAEVYKELSEAKARVIKLEAALTDIAEYWNGRVNERAMEDACVHVTNVAQQAIREEGEA